MMRELQGTCLLHNNSEEHGVTAGLSGCTQPPNHPRHHGLTNKLLCASISFLSRNPKGIDLKQLSEFNELKIKMKKMKSS